MTARPDLSSFPDRPAYLWDRREADFVLWEFFRLEQTLLNRAPFPALAFGMQVASFAVVRRSTTLVGAPPTVGPRGRRAPYDGA